MFASSCGVRGVHDVEARRRPEWLMPELKFSKATAWRLEKTAVWLCHGAAGCNRRLWLLADLNDNVV